MGARTTARECALMILFGLEAEPGDADTAIRGFFATMATDLGILSDEDARTYTGELVRGVMADVAALDTKIGAASQNWRVERMSRVDRNVLRLAVWELEHGVPRAVAIDEAIELGKRFGTEESGRFLNGILERVAKNLGAK
ncbi:MAG TPA: transcription antitermination factor NusB [Polyangiaceae bacterium]|jgi:N utilization substance protein B|nr:transcription antitermination factor NusB [Polyangiaceae bacterium]